MLIVYLLILRFVHIVASVCWVGGALIYFFFVEPTAKAMAPEGRQFVQYMVTKRRYSIFMAISSTLTVLSGALLIWRSASGNWLSYVSSGPGLGFSLGALAGLAVYFLGMFGVKPRAEHMVKVGREIELAGGPPTPAQGQLLHKLDRELSSLGMAEFVLVALSLGLMATARFWLF